jgi:cytochrome c biogenesis protein CcdA
MKPLLRFAAACAMLTAGAAAYAQLRAVQAELTPLVGSDGVHAGATVRAALHVRLPEGYHVNSNRPREPLLIPTVLSVQAPPGISVTELVYPDAIELRQQGASQPLAVYERDFAIGVQLAVEPGVAAGVITVPAAFRYQACDEKLCYAPITVPTSWPLRVVPASVAVTARHTDVLDRLAFGRGEPPPSAAAVPELVADPLSTPAPPVAATRATLEDFTILGTTGGYLNAGDFLQFIRNAEAGIRDAGMFEGRGPLAILAIVLIGGLALNLTPCVLPMIPINLAIIGAGARAGSRRRGFLLGATYGGAMAAAYGVLGLIVILTAGTFGTINASPWFNAGIALLFVVLGLAMFDVLTIDFSRFSTRLEAGRVARGSFPMAFAMGAVAALLAGACVAPVVIQVVLFASSLYATGTTAALALPFFLGLGMAIPWPIAGAGIAALPRPGAWMVRVKQAFGVVILATAAYYGYLAYGLFANRWVDPLEVSSSVEEKLKEGWYASLGEGLAAAKREGKPVLIDLWATWCKNCLVMDQTTLKEPEVARALTGYVKIKYQAEDPNQSPAREVMASLGAVGLPTYVILEAR